MVSPEGTRGFGVQVTLYASIELVDTDRGAVTRT